MKVKIYHLVVLVFLSLFSTKIYSQWTIDKISIGFENGIKKDFTTFVQNDGKYFLPPQYNWLGYRFLMGDYYYGGNVNLFFKNKFVFDFGVFTFSDNDYSILYIPELKKGSTSYFSSPFLKLVTGLGRDIRIKGRLYYNVSAHLSYIRTDYYFSEWSSSGQSIDEAYISTHRTKYFSNNNFTVGLRNMLHWKFNEYLNLNFGFSYNTGLQKFSETEQTLTLSENQETVYTATSNSRLSHSTLFLSAQYNIWHKK